MAAGQGFKTFTTGEVLTAGDVNGYLMQGINVFTNATARDAAITAPAEGQFAFTKDNNSLWYYDGAAWVASGATGDIEGVTAGVGISGGGTSGTVTVTNSMATEIAAKGDLIVGTGSQTFDNLTVGTNGHTLVADSATATGLKWVAPAAGGMTLLSTTTLSGATVTLSSISQDYVSLYAVIEGVTNATADGLFQINLNNGDQQQNISIMGNNNTVTTNADYLGKINSKINLLRTNAENAFVLQVDNYTSTTNPKVWQFYGGYINTSSAFGTINAAGGAVRTPFAAITSIVFSNSGGNLTAGTVRLYGVK